MDQPVGQQGSQSVTVKPPSSPTVNDALMTEALFARDPDSVLRPFRSAKLQVAVRHPGQGRGVFVEDDVHEGELLLVDMPLAVSAPMRSEEDANEHLAEQLCGLAQRSPFMCRVICCLTDGESAPAWVTAACFDNDDAPALDYPDTRVMDKECALRIVQHNAFSGQSRTQLTVTVIYGFTSMHNHACAPSAVCYTVGTAKVVRACRALRKGDEVTIMYFSTLGKSLDKRLDVTKLVWGFVCSCAWCRDDDALLRQAVGAPALMTRLHELLAHPADDGVDRVHAALQRILFTHSPGSLQHCHVACTYFLAARRASGDHGAPPLVDRVLRIRYGLSADFLHNNRERVAEHVAGCHRPLHATDQTWAEWCNKLV